ncbi:hypothetical protein PIB30_044782 [Stylosanthes scabra]|uniref:Uncharacterized protein n=1 Tax=Stylosanthes scabra TaxID=79078 RepID=A0ABU6SH58_9FABA|nr:hypothetical protein [Stylosanthes scabra]
MVLKTGSDRTVEPVRPSTGHESGSVCMPKPPVEKPSDNRRTGRFPNAPSLQPVSKIASHSTLPFFETAETLVPSPSSIFIAATSPSSSPLRHRRISIAGGFLLVSLTSPSPSPPCFRAVLSSRRERCPSSPRAVAIPGHSPSPCAR